MNKRKSIIFHLFLLLVALSCILFLSACNADGTQTGDSDNLEENAGTNEIGMKFDVSAEYKTDILEMPLPMTYEAAVCFPAGYTERGGVIFGNYVDSNSACVNFEVYKYGIPRVYIIDNNGKCYNIVFNQIDVCNGKPTHIAISGDINTGKWKCYIDGKLAQTIDEAVPKTFNLISDFAFGGDKRGGNSQYFKGELYSLRLYSDIRMPEEIALDATRDENDEDNLITAYDVSASDEWKTEGINAIGDQKFNLSLITNWIKEIPEPEDYAYSFAVIGDIQTLNYSYPEKLLDMFEWIRDNKEEKKIAFSVGLGDVTEKNSQREYLNAIEAYDKIDGTVPFSIIRGNHDRSGYSSEIYDTYITQEKYSDEITGSYDSSMLNTYRILKVGEVDYLFMNLDYLLADEVIAWANDVIAEHPECHVIVSTHIYMSNTGSYYKLDGNSGIGKKYGAKNNGEVLWDKLLSRHENIVMLICGHNPTDDIYYRQREGINGNKVTEILIDPQSTDKNYTGTGLVAMFYFSKDGKHLDVQYYSTAKDAFFKTNNQFSLDLDTPNK